MPESLSLRIRSRLISRGDLSGAFADLGVLIPLEAALIAVNGINPTSTLLGVGLAYIGAGLYFRIPMPVQPLKAFSIIAIAQALTPSVIAAGALLMSLFLFLLASTRAVEYLTRAVPLSVVRGVQFALGIILIRSALRMVFSEPFLVGGDVQRYIGVAGTEVSLGLLVGLGGVLLLLLFLWRPLLPAAALVTVVGVGIGVALVEDGMAFTLGPADMAFAVPATSDFLTALVVLVIPQLPLTLANSVIATVDVARTYYGRHAVRVTPIRTSLSVAAGNVWAGLAGGLPMCHGSGGLTAHYRMGARTPASTVLIGGVLIALALAFGQSALAVRSLMPYAVLGALLIYVGAQHLLLGLNVTGKRDLLVVIVVGAVAAAPFANLAIGAGAGFVIYWVARWTSTFSRGR
jgi:SulP family sulfate permease